MKNKRIPPTVLTMAAGMLAPYVIGMTPAALQGMIEDVTTGPAAEPANAKEKKAASDYLTPKQFAEKMKVSYRTVQNWMVAGLIPGMVRVSPRVIRIPEDAFTLGSTQPRQ